MLTCLRWRWREISSSDIKSVKTLRDHRGLSFQNYPLTYVLTRQYGEYTVKYSTVYYITVHYITLQYSTVQYSTVQYRTVLSDPLTFSV